MQIGADHCITLPRQRLDEVPRDKPVYTYCRSGFRSYIAYCTLKQNGWDDAALLSGGMMTYHGFHRTPLTVGTGGMPVVTNPIENRWPSVRGRTSAPVSAVPSNERARYEPRRTNRRCGS